MFTLLPFNGFSNDELVNEFITSRDKLNEALENSALPNFMNKFKPYFYQVGIDSKYFTEDEFNSHVKSSNEKLFIFHVNIRSLNKHHNDLTIYLFMLDTKFDVICLSEIWSYNLEVYKAIFQGYIAHFQSPTETIVGGVALFIKNQYKTTEKKDLKTVNSDEVKVEDLWIEVTSISDETFLISVFYRHPKGNVNHFSNSMEDIITKVIDDRKIQDCIIVGDMNIDLIKYDIHQILLSFEVSCL